MADFWIKLEKNTPDKPEIYEIAQILSIDPDAVLGKLIRVWCWVDSNSSDGHIKSVTSVLIDRLTMSQGFAEAMRTVGWLEENSIPNFERHLGESAKKRAKDAERKRMSRTSSDKCHKESVTENGLDKSRVDKSILNNKPMWADEYINEFWAAYPKKEDKKKSTERLGKMIKKNPDQEFFSMILSQVKKKAMVTERQFWPSPDRYLRDEKWTDEIIGDYQHETNRSKPARKQTAIERMEEQMRTDDLQRSAHKNHGKVLDAHDSVVSTQVGEH